MTNDDTQSGAAGERAGEHTMTDEERAELLKEQIRRLHVIDVVYDMMVQLVQLGYQKLGLTGETRELRDLDDARVAIEALRRLIEVAEGAGEKDVASLRSTLAQMQLNFARAAGEVERRPAAAATEPSHEGAPQPEPTTEPKAAPRSRAKPKPKPKPMAKSKRTPASDPEPDPGAAKGRKRASGSGKRPDGAPDA
jgi:hypothetical protein